MSSSNLLLSRESMKQKLGSNSEMKLKECAYDEKFRVKKKNVEEDLCNTKTVGLDAIYS